MANFSTEVKKYCDLTIEDMNDLGLEIPEELLDLLNKLPYSVCCPDGTGTSCYADIIATICGLHSVYGKMLWSWGMDLTQTIRDAFENTEVYSSYGEDNELNGTVGNLYNYEYFGVNAGKYIGEFVETNRDPRNLDLDGLCTAICWLGGWEEEEKAYESA